MFGYVVLANNTPVAWAAKKLKIVPQSSMEAETAAMCAGTKVLVFIKSLFALLGMIADLPMNVYTDNDAARLTVINPGTTARTKHYETWMQYCRELFLKLLIKVEWVPTTEMLADIFTKPLDKTTFLKFRPYLVTERA